MRGFKAILSFFAMMTVASFVQAQTGMSVYRGSETLFLESSHEISQEADASGSESTISGAGETAACCIGQICVPGFTAGGCFDNGGVWLGIGSTCQEANANGYCVAPPPCPPGATVDQDGVSCGQPFPDAHNSGCLHPSSPFQFLGTMDGCGQVVCGMASADDRNFGNRDTDWYFFSSLESAEYTICVTAQFFPEIQIWPLNPGVDPCLGVVPTVKETGSPGESVCAIACVIGGEPYAAVVTTADKNGNPQRLGIGCVDYVLEFNCEACPVGACCNDANLCQTNINEVDCIAAGGEYLGDGADCENAICGGACCLVSGQCLEGVSRTDCIGMNGAYGGRDSECTAADCPVCSFEDPDDRDLLAGVEEDCTILGIDSVNGGCGSGTSGLDFTMISCGETVCGSTGFDGFTRDLDWYHFVVSQETETVFEIDNQMANNHALVFQLQWRDPDDPNTQFCGDGVSLIPPNVGNGLPPGKSYFSVVLSPARYTLIVTYDFDSSPVLPPDCPNDTRYRLAVECLDECTFSCVTTEIEPSCGEFNQVNSGCSASPPGNFTPLTITSGAWVCGNTRLEQIDDGMGNVDVRRDVDWWRFTSTSPELALEFEAEFEAVLIVQPLGAAALCDLEPVFTARVTQCELLSVYLKDLPLGDYGLFVAPALDAYTWFLDPPAEERCESRYRLRACNCVLEDTCFNALCGDANCDGTISVSDIGFFVTALAHGEAAWNASFPGGVAPCDYCVNDINGNGFVTVSDIGPFVNAITNDGCQ